MTQSSGTIESQFRDVHIGGVDCFWVIQAEKDMLAEVNIRWIQIEETSPCKDYLLVSTIKLIYAETIQTIIYSMMTLEANPSFEI